MWLEKYFRRKKVAPCRGNDLEALKKARRERAQDLWHEAGRPSDQSPDAFLDRVSENEFYCFKNGETDECIFVYRKDGSENTKEALSFLKDWVTSIIQLETGALAVFGLAAGFSEVFTSASTRISPHLAVPLIIKIFTGIELTLIVLSGLSILLSMASGIDLLNALPAAVQRLPASACARQSDIFSVRNEQHSDSIYEMAQRFRHWFFLGVVLFAIFVFVRLSQQFYNII